MDGVELVNTLNAIGARNGIGIDDLVENRLVGMKSRGVYENPCGSILFYAHTELERLCLDRATFHFKEIAAVKYSELVYDGMWFAPLREALQAFADKTSETVTGKVTLRLYKGNIMSNGAESRTPCIMKNSSPSVKMMYTIRQMQKASSTSSVCRSPSVPS